MEDEKRHKSEIRGAPGRGATEDPKGVRVILTLSRRGRLPTHANPTSRRKE